jgi:pimeloyl-ACP methyl ester carboxylesterase
MTDTAPAATDVRYEQVDLHIGGVALRIAAVGRNGDLAPVVFLHGFGSTKEDYLDIACQHAFAGRPFLAYDAPGCGETSCEDLSRISIPFLVKTAQAMLDHSGIRRFHLVGHSMGGLTALMLAHQEPDRVLSFTDIEGNLAPEDCFLSRQILTHPSDDDHGFLDDFVQRARRSCSSSSALFAVSLRDKVRPGAVRGIFRSMVDLSDHDDLMPKFLALPCPRMFMYGEEKLHAVVPGEAGRKRCGARGDPAQRALADVRQPGRDVGPDCRVHPPRPGALISIAPTSASGIRPKRRPLAPRLSWPICLAGAAECSADIRAIARGPGSNPVAPPGGLHVQWGILTVVSSFPLEPGRSLLRAYPVSSVIPSAIFRVSGQRFPRLRQLAAAVP